MAEHDAMTDDEAMLVVIDTISKKLSEQLDTKNPNSLRSRVDERRRLLYEQTGAKSSDVRLLGEKVGTYSIRMSKPKESSQDERFEVEDYEALAKFVIAECADYAMQYISNDLAAFAVWYLDYTGEMPEGCTLKKYVTPAVEPQYMGGTLKVDAGKVAEVVRRDAQLNAAFGSLLGGRVLMLGSGEDDIEVKS